MNRVIAKKDHQNMASLKHTFVYVKILLFVTIGTKIVSSLSQESLTNLAKYAESLTEILRSDASARRSTLETNFFDPDYNRSLVSQLNSLLFTNKNLSFLIWNFVYFIIIL